MNELDFAHIEDHTQYPFDCFDAAIEKHKSEFDLLLDSTGNQSLRQQEREQSQALYLEVQDILMGQCDSYYRYVDTIRYVGLKWMAPTGDQNHMDTLNSQVEKHPNNSEHFLNRGLVAFQQGSYDLADQDFDQALGLDSLNLNALFCKACIQEIYGNFDPAIAYYKRYQYLSRKPLVAGVIRICERKAWANKK